MINNFIAPALNESDNIRRLAEEIQATKPVEVIVVDNGSTDDTARKDERAGVQVISESRRGFEYACSV